MSTIGFFQSFIVSLQHMNKLKITTILASILILTGCLGGESPESGSAIGGIMRSDDSGNLFVSKSMIDEKTSLVKTSVLSMAVDPSNGNTLYAGTQQSGLFVSDDNGEIWRSLNFPLTSIKKIAINPYNTNNIYISGMLSGRGTIYRTDDKGENFQQVYIEPLDGTNITSLAIHPEDPSIVYAGLSSGLLIQTSDGGSTWEDLVIFEGFDVEEILFDASDSQTVYVLSVNDGVFKSRDGGRDFVSILDLDRDEKQMIYEGVVYSLAVSPSISGAVLVGTDNGIFQSEDYGKSWDQIDTIESTDGIPIYALAVNPHNTDQVVYAAAKAVYTKIGNSWAVTDTTSNRAVSVIRHNPIRDGVVYLGLMSLGE